MIYADQIDSELLSEMLLILRDLTKIRAGKFDFSDDFVVFPEIEKITFALGLVLTDLAGIESPYSEKILSSAGLILDDYLALIASEHTSQDLDTQIMAHFLDQPRSRATIFWEN